MKFSGIDRGFHFYIILNGRVKIALSLWFVKDIFGWWHGLVTKIVALLWWRVFSFNVGAVNVPFWRHANRG